jgi:alpha-L-rhamnosidase
MYDVGGHHAAGKGGERLRGRERHPGRRDPRRVRRIAPSEAEREAQGAGEGVWGTHETTFFGETTSSANFASPEPTSPESTPEPTTPTVPEQTITPEDTSEETVSFSQEQTTRLELRGVLVGALATIGDDAAATIYLYIAADLTARIAGMLGEAGTERRLRSMAEEVKGAFAREFITPAGRLVYDDQTSYALAFLYDLIPEAHHEAAKRYFRATIARAEGRVGTGFIGTPALLRALVKIGERELAAKVFLQEEVPGWLYQVKMGATSIWERWDAIKPDGTIFEPKMNSYNHYAYGAVCQWLFEGVAGFRPDPEQPGFRHVIFEPAIIPALSPVAAHHDTVHGRVAAGWEVEDDRVTYTITVPEEGTGTLRLPPDYFDVVVDGTPLGRAGTGPAGRALGPGRRHTITFRINPQENALPAG